MFEAESTQVHVALTSGLDTDDAAEYLRSEHGLDYRPSYLMKLRSIGGGPAFYRVGRTIRYLPPHLDEYAKSRICGPLATSREGVRAT
jgi:hypothetical protein